MFSFPTRDASPEMLLRLISRQEYGLANTIGDIASQLGPAAPLDAIRQAFNDPSDLTRQYVLVALGALHEYISVELILSLIEQEQNREEPGRPDINVLLRAYQTLSQFGARLSPALLVDALRYCTLHDCPCCLSHHDAVFKVVVEQAPIQELLDGLADYNTIVRETMAQALGPSYEQITPEKLVAALAKSESDLCVAIGIIGVAADERFLDLLLALLETASSNPAVHCAVLQALGNLGERCPVEPLMAALSGKNGWHVQQEAVLILRRLHATFPVEPLVEALSADDSSLREAALRVLGAFGERAPLQPLLDLLHKPHENRRAARSALAELGRYISLEMYQSLMEQQGWFIERALREGLANLCSSLPQGRLINALATLEHGSLRQAFLEFMSESCEMSQLYEYPAFALLIQMHNRRPSLDDHRRTDETPLDFLLSLLSSDEEFYDLRQEAERALDAISFVMPATLLEKLEHHSSPQARGLAIRIMGRAGKQTPVHKLLAALDDEEYEVWSAAQEAIAGLRDPDLAGPLLEALPRLDPLESLDPLEALVQMGCEIPAKPLMQVLGHLDFTGLKHMDMETVPLRAAHLLKQAHPSLFQMVVSQAVDILQGGPVTGVFEPRVKSRLAQTLAWMGRATVEQLLLLSELLASPHWQVCLKAAEASGSVECRLPEGIIHRLMELRDDPLSFERIRRAAEDALHNRGYSRRE